MDSIDEWGPRVVRINPPNDLPFHVLGENGEIWYRVDADDIGSILDYQVETMLDVEPHIKPFEINAAILRQFTGLEAFVLGYIEVSDDGEYRIIRTSKPRSQLTREQVEQIQLAASVNAGLERLTTMGLPDTPEAMAQATREYVQTRKRVERMAARGIHWYLPFH